MSLKRDPSRPSLITLTRRLALGCGLALLVLAVPGRAHAFDYTLQLQGGVAAPLSSPQSDLFNLGGAVNAKLLIGLAPYLDVGPTFGFVGLPASSANPDTDSGHVWRLGGGLRIKRPHSEGHGFGAISPWLDGDLLYVRTGDLGRLGFQVGAGFSFPLDERRFWLGPYLRYLQVVQPGTRGNDDRDAKILIAGLSIEFDGGHRHPQAPEEAVVCPPAPIPATCPPIAQLPDGDGDGVPDMFDRCPDVSGPIHNQGCPLYDKIIVKEDKLELKEHIQFAWDAATIDPVSDPLLDQVVQALKDNKSFNVRIEGHTSSEGTDDHNQSLSEQRAQAVLDYLVAHGVPKERLAYKGFSSSEPLQTNTTTEGREANRRVEFKVDLIILNKGSDE